MGLILYDLQHLSDQQYIETSCNMRRGIEKQEKEKLPEAGVGFMVTLEAA